MIYIWINSIPEPAMIALYGFIGACIGSFINVVAYRYPIMLQRQWEREAKLFTQMPGEPESAEQLLKEQEMLDEMIKEQGVFNLAVPRSHCPHCNNAIPWYRNIPLFSWLWLRGKCQDCKNPISGQYFVVELLCMLVALVIALHISPYTGAALALCVLCWGLIAIAAIDGRSGLIPDVMSLGLLWGGLLYNLEDGFVPIEISIYGAALGYMLLRSFATIFEVYKGHPVMGAGDWKMFAAIGAWLGYLSFPWVLLCAPFALLLWYGPQKRKKGSTVHFGPGLAIGALIVIAPYLLGRYLPFEYQLWLLTMTEIRFY